MPTQKSVINLASAGVSLNYAVETTAGTKPPTGYTKISGMKSIPSLNPAPENMESTTLDATEYKTYIAGLKDTGGALAFKANLSEALIDSWDTVLSDYNTAKAANKSMWFCVVIPGLAKGVYFTGEPSKQGLPAIEVGAVLETELFITPTNEPKWETKPTTV